MTHNQGNADSRPTISFGTASLGAFVAASSYLLSSFVWYFGSRLLGVSAQAGSIDARSMVTQMIHLTPVYLLGTLSGIVGLKRSADNAPSARAGIWCNCCALIPMNCVPLISFFCTNLFRANQ